MQKVIIHLSWEKNEMLLKIVPQTGISGVNRICVGDTITTALADVRHSTLKFAVAYMRLSGLNRLSTHLEAFLLRGGTISGAVGIDGGITTIEALQALNVLSSNSSVLHTVSGFIYHPKLYLIRGSDHATVIVGSANLTRDGLYRNIEFATMLELDLTSRADSQTCAEFERFLDAVLDATHPNVKKLSSQTIAILAKCGLVQSESVSREPGSGARKTRAQPTAIDKLFPQIRVPVPPPVLKNIMPSQAVGKTSRKAKGKPKKRVATVRASSASTFTMKLSAFDCSHRTGVKGTPEILVPHAAVDFFPEISLTDRKYPDAIFNVVLNSPTGREIHSYRLWYYEERATGTKIDEYRFRMDHETVDLTTSGGGDILVVNRLPSGSDPAYEVTIVQQGSPEYSQFSEMCNREIRGKFWGLV